MSKYVVVATTSDLVKALDDDSITLIYVTPGTYSTGEPIVINMTRDLEITTNPYSGFNDNIKLTINTSILVYSSATNGGFYTLTLKNSIVTGALTVDANMVLSVIKNCVIHDTVILNNGNVTIEDSIIAPRTGVPSVVTLSSDVTTTGKQITITSSTLGIMNNIAIKANSYSSWYPIDIFIKDSVIYGGIALTALAQDTVKLNMHSTSITSSSSAPAISVTRALVLIIDSYVKMVQPQSAISIINSNVLCSNSRFDTLVFARVFEAEPENSLKFVGNYFNNCSVVLDNQSSVEVYVSSNKGTGTMAYTGMHKTGYETDIQTINPATTLIKIPAIITSDGVITSTEPLYEFLPKVVDKTAVKVTVSLNLTHGKKVIVHKAYSNFNSQSKVRVKTLQVFYTVDNSHITISTINVELFEALESQETLLNTRVNITFVDSLSSVITTITRDLQSPLRFFVEPDVTNISVKISEYGIIDIPGEVIGRFARIIATFSIIDNLSNAIYYETVQMK